MSWLFVCVFADCMVESYCATLCTLLNDTCTSAIFAAVSETCHIFPDSQLSSLIISPNSTQLSYFEKKPSCDWTATAGFEVTSYRQVHTFRVKKSEFTFICKQTNSHSRSVRVISLPLNCKKATYPTYPRISD